MTNAVLAAQLRRVLGVRVCVVGVGNRHRGDDAIGCAVVDALAGRTAATLVDAGEVPENHLERIVRSRPDTVLLVDAAELGAAPGAARVIPLEMVRRARVSTHASSLDLCAEYVVARTGARVALLGIQPAALGRRRGLTAEAASAVTEVCDVLARLLPASGVLEALGGLAEG